MSLAGGLGGAASGAAMGAAFGPIGMGVGALAGGLMGGLSDTGGGGGPSASAGPGGMPMGGALAAPTNQIVNLDVTNNNVSSPININIGGTQAPPDGSIGNRAGMPTALPVSYAEYGTLDYNSRTAYVNEMGSPVFHDGFPFGADPATNAPGNPIMTALPFVVAGLAVLFVLKKLKR